MKQETAMLEVGSKVLTLLDNGAIMSTHTIERVTKTMAESSTGFQFKREIKTSSFRSEGDPVTFYVDSKGRSHYTYVLDADHHRAKDQEVKIMKAVRKFDMTRIPSEKCEEVYNFLKSLNLL
jgi:hypothetical protein